MSEGSKRAAVWLADGVEEMEAVIILDVLRRGKLDVRGVSLGDRREVKGSRGVVLVADTAWDEAWLRAADLLVVPGGMGGMEALRADSRVLDHLRRATAEGKWVAAVCAGPLVLARAGLLAGRKATCYPGLEGELAGAVPSPARVVVDGRLVTSQGPGTAMEFSVALLRALAGDAVADSVAKGLLLPR